MNFNGVLPNVTHKYLKKLEDKNKLKAIVTQNIDGLHQKAGSKNVIELHGTTLESFCMKCGTKYDGNYIFKSKGIPTCKCGGIVRPNIVLYGEGLGNAYDMAYDYINKCDLLIVAGTSLTVEPSCSLVRNYNGKNLVIINESETPYDYKASLLIKNSLGNIFKNLK